MTNIKDIYCLDINWIDERIQLLTRKGISYMGENYPLAHASINGSTKELQELKAQLKPIQPLIEDTFDKGLEFGRQETLNTKGILRNQDFTALDKEEYINTKQFEL